jgi:glucans biosynthesis protein
MTGRLLLLLLPALPAAAAGPRFDLDTVAARARELAAAPHDAAQGPVPPWLLEITYDRWRDIRFRPERALWAGQGLPFTVQFFHPGFLYNRTVAINTVDGTGVHPAPFTPGQFDYGQNDFASRVPQLLGYAGFRIHHPIKRPTYHDEIIVYLGASYFRAVSRRTAFGLSARGLAIDTALSSGEEFPSFREFWLVRPAKGTRTMVVYALLDSRRATGAYRFEITPGDATLVKVEQRVFLREPVRKLGIAPLTSMFFRGENTIRPIEDYRPETHDSDGLLLLTSAGEWVWRPLDNPERLQVNSFEVPPNPRGFGLVQRDRDLEHYQDFEARYDQRPSTWVAPQGDWGVGHVELVEIPTRDDTNDNVVAFWVPAVPLEAGTELRHAYTISWYEDDPKRPPAGRTIATRRDRGTAEDAYRFVVDFAGPELARLPPESVLEGVVTVGSGGDAQSMLLDQQVLKNPVTNGWRLVFQVRPTVDDPIPMRAFLRKGPDALTETWSYLLRP